MSRSARTFDTSISPRLRARLPVRVADMVIFVLKHAWAALFAILILSAVIITKLIWQDGWAITRYDALFVIAIAIQAAMLLFKLETWQEAKVIALFHLTGTAMEFFKVSAGSWTYPEEAILKVLGVPLFSGFMYASVGSYIARVIRVFDLRFSPYPPFWMTALLAIAIYVNFFAHHFIVDTRVVLFGATVVLFWRTRVLFATGKPFGIPMPLAVLCASFMLWIAENIGTLTGTWVYAGTTDFSMTSFSKLGSWYLLLYVAFVTVTVVVRDPLDIKRNRATTSR